MYNSHHKDLIYDKKIIFNKYIKSWFFLDLLSIYPTEIFKYITDSDLNLKGGILYLPYYNDVLKILLLPKTYYAFKFNVFDIKQLKMSTAHHRLMTFLVNVILVSHIVGCIWYYCARVYDFSESTWVYE